MPSLWRRVASLLSVWACFALSPALAAIRPGTETHLTLPSSPADPVSFDLEADGDGPLVIEARSLALDVRIEVHAYATNGEITQPPIAQDDNSLGGTNAVVSFAAEVSRRYRVTISRADPTEKEGGEAIVRVLPGPRTPQTEADKERADQEYWAAVQAAGETNGNPALRIRGRMGLVVRDYQAGRYAAGASLAREALEIAEQAYGPHDRRLGPILGDLGLLLQLSGDYSEALIPARRAVEILVPVWGEIDGRVASARNTLGSILQDLGELHQAREQLELAVHAREALHGPESPEILPALSNLANVISDLGDTAAVLPVRERLLAIGEHAYGPDSTRIAGLLNNLAFALHRLERDSESVTLYQRALAIRLNRLGDNHPLTALSRQNLAVAWFRLGELSRAEELLRVALAQREQLLGPEHPDVALTLVNLSDVLRAQARWEEALQLLERAQSIRLRAVGPSHPLSAEVQERRARTLLGLERHAEALDAALSAEQGGRATARAIARGLPDQAALRYAALRVDGLDAAIATLAAVGTPDSASIERVWQELTLSRALVLDTMATRIAELSAASDAEANAARDRLALASERWARLVAGRTELRGAALQEAIGAAARDRAARELELAKLSQRFARNLDQRDSSLAELLGMLPARSALIAYARYAADSTSARERYAAFARAPDGRLVFRDLGDAAAIDRLVSAWRASLRGLTGDLTQDLAHEERSRQAGARLRRAVWDKVASALGKPDRVVIVTDGTLQLVPFSALPAPAGGYLVERGPILEYRSAERDVLLARDDGERSTSGALLALGAPAFDQTPATSATARRSERMLRGSSAQCTEFGKLRFTPLPAAGDEVRAVAQILGQDARVLTGLDASEESFKQLAPHSRILHLATHGFVASEKCGNGIDAPLKLAGLALAGANRRAATQPLVGEDGILTAEEIAALDLSAVAWVALSACDTGLGEIAAGEGVLGLRRAFTIAGVDTLLTALWSVDDRDARGFMTELYRARFERGLSTAEASRSASRALLEARRNRKLDTSPVRWGAFLAVGR